MAMTIQRHDVARVAIELPGGEILESRCVQIVSTNVITRRDHRPEAHRATLPTLVDTCFDQIALQALTTKIRIHHATDQLWRGFAHRVDLVRVAPGGPHRSGREREIQHTVGDHVRMCFDTHAQMRCFEVGAQEPCFVRFATVVIRVLKAMQHALAQRLQCGQVGDSQWCDMQGAW